MEKEMIKVVMAILVSGAFSTAATVIAVDLHINYVKEDIKKLEIVDIEQNMRLRQIEIAQAKQQRVTKL